MPAGTYCNVILGDYDNGSCSGPTIDVHLMGLLTLMSLVGVRLLSMWALR